VRSVTTTVYDTNATETHRLRAGGKSRERPPEEDYIDSNCHALHPTISIT